MYTFTELLKKIRLASGLTQAELAQVLEVSVVLIAMLETGQKKVSKKMLIKIADSMGVHPMSITPFLFISGEENIKKMNPLERVLFTTGEQLQGFLINKKAGNLKKYVQRPLSETSD